MIAIHGQPILTAARMRAVEAASGRTTDALMARAGAAIAEQVRRLAMGAEVLVACGPGNNGGDGYVAATILRRAGVPVRVAAAGEPRGDAAIRARAGWGAAVEALQAAAPAPVFVDALFGTGMARALAPAVDAALARTTQAAGLRIAIDLPSGVDAARGTVPAWLADTRVDVTLALGAVKPAHVLQPSAPACGTVRVVGIGLEPPARSGRYRLCDEWWGNDHVVAPPLLRSPGPDAHKYTRGMVAVVAGAMEGAARLCATAALRAGAGYAALYGGSGSGGPDALVHRGYDRADLRDPRIGTIVVGPGLGREAGARERLVAAIEDDAAALVIDGDALHLLDPAMLRGRTKPVVLTPHAGEFAALFGEIAGSAIDRARSAAERAHGHVVVLKGAATVVADAARAVVSPNGSGWLSTAGTGDVLAGAVAAMLASGGDPLEDAADGVWLHADAARRCGASFIADDLAHALSDARGSL